MPRLIVEQGKDSGAEVLVVDAVTAGRDPSCGLPLHDRQSSRQHCRFEAAGDRLTVTDLGSRNGILVNGAKVPSAELKAGDRVAIGGTVVRVAEAMVGSWSGKTLAGYRFLDKIGEGGMGEVYRSEQLSMRRFIAAKVLSAKLSEDPRYVERLLQEARAAAKLNHPGLIQVHDVIQAPEITFFSMELVQGTTLRAHLRRGPLPVATVLAVARQVAEALRYAHAKGIVHHDVKPENVMLAEDGQVKLADLGIAQPSGARLGETGKRRTLVGTPQYMPPDQVTGERVDPRFDLYALGATCYHALAGQPPYRGVSPEDIVRQLCAVPPPPLASLAPAVPAEVVQWIGRLMARDPEKRTPTAEQAVQEIRALQGTYGTGEAATHGGTATTGGASRTNGIPTPAAISRPRKACMAAAAVALLVGVAYVAKVAAERFLVTPPSKPPVQPPPPPVQPIPPHVLQVREHLAKAREARAQARLDDARALYEAALALDPAEAERLEARQGLQDVAAEAVRAEVEAVWSRFREALDAEADPKVRAAKLQQFAAEHAGNPHAPEAARMLSAIRRELDAAEAAERLRQLQARTEEASRDARALADRSPPRFAAAQALLEGFRRARPDMPPETAARIADEEQALKRRKADYWKRTKEEVDDLVKREAYAKAQGALDDLAALEGEGWGDLIKAPKSSLDAAMDARAARGEKAAAECVDRFDFPAAEQALRECGGPLAGTSRAEAMAVPLAKCRALAAGHRAVVGKIATAAQHCKVEVRRSPGRIQSATPEDVTVRLDGGGAITKAAWQELPPQALLAVWRHYLDMREPEANYWVFCLCWQKGLWKDAETPREKAKGLIAQVPGMEEAFARGLPAVKQ